MTKDNKEIKSSKKKKVIVQKSNEELLEEIMQRKRARVAKREAKTKTIKIEKLKELAQEINNEDKDSNIENTKVIDSVEEEKLKDKHIIPKEKEDEELFKTKVLPMSYINDITETIDLTEILKEEKKSRFKFIFLVPVLLLIILLVIFILFRREDIKLNETKIGDILVTDYDQVNDMVKISVLPTKKQKECAVVEEMVEDTSTLNFRELDNGSCVADVSRKPYYIYFKDALSLISEPLEVNDYLVRINVDDNYYVVPGTEVNLGTDIVTVGDVDIVWSSLEGEVTVNNNVYVNNEAKKVTLQAMVDGRVVAKTNVYTTNVITKMPKEYDTKKPYLSCKQYTHDEAVLLDEIFFDRIEKAGEGTRAGAVAAARFLTLELPYRIAYYHENGRVNKTGVHFVDGEGRYYHKGLYLDESKYDDLQASFFGPAMWGCKMVTYEDDPPWFVPGRKYPNGFDCSGFVSWALYNGGFDVGDYGAGQSEGRLDLTDYGEAASLTPKLIKSGKIKVGDLFNFWGHISILVGQDDSYFYIAESLQPYGGLVVKKYSKRNVMDTFPYVILMDKLYKEDGNLTDMWY